MLKPIAFIIALLATASLNAAAPISQSDRDALIKDLEQSRAAFLAAIADVTTEAQWNYKPAPDRWSVGECAAHIIAVEEYFRQNIATALKSPALPAAQQSTAGDAAMVKMIRDRSQRFTAPAGLEPTGKVVPKARAIKDFEAREDAGLRANDEGPAAGARIGNRAQHHVGVSAGPDAGRPHRAAHGAA